VTNARRSWLLAALALLLLAGCGLRGANTLRTSVDVQRITPQEAYHAVARGEAVVYDVRLRAAYAAEHIAGALALPEAELDTLIGELSDDKTLILYCT